MYAKAPHPKKALKAETLCGASTFFFLIKKQLWNMILSNLYYHDCYIYIYIYIYTPTTIYDCACRENPNTLRRQSCLKF